MKNSTICQILGDRRTCISWLWREQQVTVAVYCILCVQPSVRSVYCNVDWYNIKICKELTIRHKFAKN
jgi:hypothetical protein